MIGALAQALQNVSFRTFRFSNLQNTKEMKILLYLTVISSSYGCFSKWFGKREEEETSVSRDVFIPQTVTTKKTHAAPAARQRSSNRNRGPVDIGTYRDQSDNRFMSQDVNNYTQVI